MHTQTEYIQADLTNTVITPFALKYRVSISITVVVIYINVTLPNLVMVILFLIF